MVQSGLMLTYFNSAPWRLFVSIGRDAVGATFPSLPWRTSLYCEE
jgi:hypothetical protein